VADLEDELGVLAEGRRLVGRDLGVGVVRALLGEIRVRVRAFLIWDTLSVARRSK
jgi:hypothetical protein